MARLVTRGFTQIEDINLNEKISLVAQMELIWIVFVVIAIQDFEVHQIDVKISFLNGNLWKEIYMQQLEGFVVKGVGHSLA